MSYIEKCVQVHKFGYVELLDYMGSDEDIVDAARISYDRRGEAEDRNLIRYLLRNKHTSPFEMAVLKFEIKMPIFVARQWVRHRTASMNEVSARYTQLPNEMFVPEVFAVQSTDNKQGRSAHGNELSYRADVQASHEAAYSLYEHMLDDGVARELARGVLPLNIYTKFVWKMDLHNIMHFLNLRLDEHAQQEIRDYAVVIENMVAGLFPLCHEAFVDYVRDAYTCSRMEINVLKEMLAGLPFNVEQAFNSEYLASQHGLSKREIEEFHKKFCGFTF